MAEERIGVRVCWVGGAGVRSADLPQPPDSGLRRPNRAGHLQRQETLRWLELEVPANSTVGALLARPELAPVAKRVHAGELAIAIYGCAAKPSTLLRDGDRVELLTELLLDPKAARAARARRRSTPDAEPDA